MHHAHTTRNGTPRRWTSALSLLLILLLILLLSSPLPHTLAGASTNEAQSTHTSSGHPCHGADALLAEPAMGTGQGPLVPGCCTGGICGICLQHAPPAGTPVHALTGIATRPSAVAESHCQPPMSPSLRPPIRA